MNSLEFVTSKKRLPALRRHIVPVALVIRLISLAANPVVAVAATVPDVQPQVLASTAAVEVSPIDPVTFLSETNSVRTREGLASLTMDSTLTVAAQRKIADMQEKGYWDHFRPGDSKAPWDFIRESGYTYTVAGENLARGFKTAHGITEAWLASPTHRANLLSPKYKDVGFATGYITTSEGQVLLTVQMFGAR